MIYLIVVAVVIAFCIYSVVKKKASENPKNMIKTHIGYACDLLEGKYARIRSVDDYWEELKRYGGVNGFIMTTHSRNFFDSAGGNEVLNYATNEQVYLIATVLDFINEDGFDFADFWLCEDLYESEDFVSIMKTLVYIRTKCNPKLSVNIFFDNGKLLDYQTICKRLENDKSGYVDKGEQNANERI